MSKATLRRTASQAALGVTGPTTLPLGLTFRFQVECLGLPVLGSNYQGLGLNYDRA